jgi:hypothetical protein
MVVCGVLVALYYHTKVFVVGCSLVLDIGRTFGLTCFFGDGDDTTRENSVVNGFFGSGKVLV